MVGYLLYQPVAVHAHGGGHDVHVAEASTHAQHIVEVEEVCAVTARQMHARPEDLVQRGVERLAEMLHTARCH